jgi:hypothetical protein
LQAPATRVAIEDIIAVEGERSPAAVARQTHDVAVLLLESDRAPLTRESCLALESALEQHFAGFERATRGRVALRNATGFGTDCESVSASPTLTTDHGCALAPGGGSHGALLLGLYCCWLSRTRRDRA